MQTKKVCFILFVVIFLSVGCKNGNHSADSLNVYAAAGVHSVVAEMVQIYEAKHETKINLNFASSGTLARQITEGGQCDVYISASQHWMDYVASKGLTRREDIRPLSSASMVLVTPTHNITYQNHILQLPGITESYIAIGDPDHVPAGKYALQALHHQKIHETLKEQLLPCKDVRSILMMVEMGECRYGIVYKTEALKSDKVRIITAFPEQSHEPVIFSGAVITKSAKYNEGSRFLDFSAGEATDRLWEKHGFSRH